MCKMKKTTKFGKLFHAYADEKGLDVLELPFYVDGERIGYDDTPETLDLSDYDSIDLSLNRLDVESKHHWSRAVHQYPL